MSFFEGNAYIHEGQFQFGNVTQSTVSNSAIITSSLDMMDSAGNLQFITNVKNPVLNQDAATKLYVDNLGISIFDVTLLNTTGTLISSALSGSYIVLVKNLELNGPSAIFNITKNEAINSAQSVRVVSAPGTNTNVALYLQWDPNNPLYLYKNSTQFDGSYRVKMM